MPGPYSETNAKSLGYDYWKSSPEKYSYLRRDLVMLFQYAVCEVNQKFPSTTPLALGDLTQSDGMTPGTDVGAPRHPTSTHRGNDLDIAYYQTDGSNNYQIICGDGSDTNGNGQAGRYNDGYFCTTNTNIVDFPRQAYFYAMMATSPLARVFGLDQTLPTAVKTELDHQLSMGWITQGQHDRVVLGYGMAGGWEFHFHHTHLSFNAP
jgi:hypothetical protein